MNPIVIDEHTRTMHNYVVTLNECVHLYVDCKFIIKYKNDSNIYWDEIGSVCSDGDFFGSNGSEYCTINKGHFETIEYVKLVLTSIENASAKTLSDYKLLVHPVVNGNLKVIADTPQSILFGVLQRLDMFDLIKNGFAIEEKEFNQIKTIQINDDI